MRTFKKSLTACAVLAALTGLSACETVAAAASMGLSDSSIASSTAATLGYSSPERVTISDRRTEGNKTYYTATAGGRTYICSILGGGYLVGRQVSEASCVPEATH